jgi:hypothetical protein
MRTQLQEAALQLEQQRRAWEAQKVGYHRQMARLMMQTLHMCCNFKLCFPPADKEMINKHIVLYFYG